MNAINRYLSGNKLTSQMLWELISEQVEQSEQGYLAFDDTVVDKNSSFQIELVRRQWSGNAGGIIKGIGIVTCVYQS